MRERKRLTETDMDRQAGRQTKRGGRERLTERQTGR